MSSATSGFCPRVAAMDILSWENGMTTGCILGSINIAFLLFGVFNFSIVCCASILALLAMGFGFIASMMTGVTQEERFEFVSKSQLEGHMISLYDVINRSASEARDIVFWRVRDNSLKACAFLAVLAYVASWLSFGVLAFLGINVLFFSQQIGQAYHKHAASYVDKICDTCRQYVDLIPKLSKQHAKTQ